MVKFFLVLGVIIMVLSGGCTLFVINMLSSSQDTVSNNWVYIVILGGIPFAIGLLLFWGAKGTLKNEPGSSDIGNHDPNAPAKEAFQKDHSNTARFFLVIGVLALVCFVAFILMMLGQLS